MSKKSKVSITLTPEQEDRMKRLLWQAWEYIGNDIMQSLSEEGKYSISRQDLIEVVLDADHVGSVARRESDKDAFGAFNNLSYKDRIRFAEKVFTAARYS